jgi:hypothetical protein
MILTQGQKAALDTFYTVTLANGSLSYSDILDNDRVTKIYKFTAPPRYQPVGVVWLGGYQTAGGFPVAALAPGIALIVNRTAIIDVRKARCKRPARIRIALYNNTPFDMAGSVATENSESICQ